MGTIAQIKARTLRRPDNSGMQKKMNIPRITHSIALTIGDIIERQNTKSEWNLEKYSEDYLLPVLKTMLPQFPFVIRGFHSDNGFEFVNHIVAKGTVKGSVWNFHRLYYGVKGDCSTPSPYWSTSSEFPFYQRPANLAASSRAFSRLGV